jgi:hypothetical protein
MGSTRLYALNGGSGPPTDLQEHNTRTLSL